jgi:hypothetical protein
MLVSETEKNAEMISKTNNIAISVDEGMSSTDQTGRVVKGKFSIGSAVGVVKAAGSREA